MAHIKNMFVLLCPQRGHIAVLLSVGMSVGMNVENLFLCHNKTTTAPISVRPGRIIACDL